ncbi:unnamed protein product [Symbiodinium natans]|uniref:Uncharacterized protein n=1 Tax=Symbiodinium natans TaxID=878477 RepID=A0A812GRN1_9DINO|nr:unnamed protein product [Symbiodinium natans]
MNRALADAFSAALASTTLDSTESSRRSRLASRTCSSKAARLEAVASMQRCLRGVHRPGALTTLMLFHERASTWGCGADAVHGRAYCSLFGPRVALPHKNAVKALYDNLRE